MRDYTDTRADGVIYLNKMVLRVFSYKTNRLPVFVLLYCNRSQKTLLRAKNVLFCSSVAMTSSVIYYSTDARKNEICLTNTCIKCIVII